VAYFDNNDLVLKNTATGAVTTLVSKPAGAGTDGYVGAAGPVGVQVLSSGGLVLLDTVKDLLPGDRNHLQSTHDESGSDVYMLDTVNNTADLVSVGTDGIAGTGQSSAASSSETGRFVAFQSDSDGFVAGDSGYSDIFVRDRLLHTTERVSVSLTGGQANGSSTHPHISGDGRYVEFRSTASNLVANDTNDHADVFIYDRRTHATQRISVGLNGQQLNVDSDAQPLPYSPLFALFTAEGANGRQDLFQHQLSIEPYERVYRSYDLQLSTTNPQGFVIPMDGWPAATVDFYESSNDFGVFQGFAPGVYTAGVHPYDFNRVAPYWSANGYFPYVGKSDVGRGADENEGNAVAPFGVRDLQMHPPADDHNMVAVFTVPETGHYSVSDLGARRVAAGGETSRLQLFNKLGVLIASVVAGNDQAWVHSNTTYDLGTLLTGEKIYFAVGRDGDWELDATEISWEIVATELFH